MKMMKKIHRYIETHYIKQLYEDAVLEGRWAEVEQSLATEYVSGSSLAFMNIVEANKVVREYLSREHTYTFEHVDCSEFFDVICTSPLASTSTFERDPAGLAATVLSSSFDFGLTTIVELSLRYEKLAQFYGSVRAYGI